MPDDDDTTQPSAVHCTHRDMAGDSAVEARGEHRWCAICGAQWIDKHAVIVNDEVG